MLLINPSQAQLANILPPGFTLTTPNNEPTTVAVETEDCRVYLATTTHRMFIGPNHGASDWLPINHHYGLQYTPDGRTSSVWSAPDPYSLPDGLIDIPSAAGNLLAAMYGKPVKGRNPCVQQYRLNLPHTLDGLSGMFQTEEE